MHAYIIATLPYMHTHTHTLTHAHAHAHAHTHTHSHTLTHTHTHTLTVRANGNAVGITHRKPTPGHGIKEVFGRTFTSKVCVCVRLFLVGDGGECV